MWLAVTRVVCVCVRVYAYVLCSVFACDDLRQVLSELVEAAQSLPDDEDLHNSVVQVAFPPSSFSRSRYALSGPLAASRPLPSPRILKPPAPPPPSLACWLSQMAMSIRPDAVKSRAGASFAAPTPPVARTRAAPARGEAGLHGEADYSHAVLMLGPLGHAAPQAALQGSRKAVPGVGRMTLDAL